MHYIDYKEVIIGLRTRRMGFCTDPSQQSLNYTNIDLITIILEILTDISFLTAAIKFSITAMRAQKMRIARIARKKISDYQKLLLLLY